MTTGHDDFGVVLVLVYFIGMISSPENTSEQVTRSQNGRWAPGRSPNPGGRPKGAGAVRELARTKTLLAIGTLTEICRNGQTDAVRVAAAIALLDRGWGKPNTIVTTKDAGPDLLELLAAAQRNASEVLDAPIFVEADCDAE